LFVGGLVAYFGAATGGVRGGDKVFHGSGGDLRPRRSKIQPVVRRSLSSGRREAEGMFVVEVYRAVRQFVFNDGKSRREALATI
jgi:hypothetical protein